MKVLLTGATGFVGSHILDALRERSLPTAVVLRSTSDTSFIREQLPDIQVFNGSILHPDSLQPAVAWATHVVHCAGCTKAARVSDFQEVNVQGTRNVVQAINASSVRPKRMVHISSLAAIGPAPGSKPALEGDPPHPTSEYGVSKLAAEMEVRKCRAEHVILRPPGVYGPRDTGFFSIFKAIRCHLLPRPSRTQALSLVYVKDLAQAVLMCLDEPTVVGKAYFVASTEVVTGRQFAEQVAAAYGTWTVPFPLQPTALWPVCAAQEMLSRFSGRPSMLNLQKYRELRAPGWVCNPGLLKRDANFSCETTLKEGIPATLEWYRRAHWL